MIGPMIPCRSLLQRLVLVVLLFGCASTPLSAQTTLDDISTRLMAKPLYLHGFWGKDKLVFDSDGNPTEPYPTVSFAEAGFDFTSVQQKGDHLEINGRRMALRIEPKGVTKRLRMQKMQIEIRGGTGTDYKKALDRIFFSDLASLTPSLPEYWQDYAQKYFLQKAPTDAAPPPVKQSNVLHIAGSIKPPRVLTMQEPLYTASGRAANFSGNVQVYLWVMEDGSPAHVKIVGPVGLGLDEAAVASVQRYTFAPATKDGKPVKVDLYIDVNFQVF